MADTVGRKTSKDNISDEPDLKIGLEEFLEDVFGLNIRSAKTILAMFKTPAIYFQAAKTKDWQQRFTPSLRLWLGLMTVSVALQFFWARPDGSLMQMLKQGLEVGFNYGVKARGGSEVDFTGFDFDTAMTAVMKLNSLIYPFIFVTIMSLLAFTYRAWGQTLTYVVRQRYIFAVIVPATVFGLASTILMTFASAEVYKVIGIIQFFVIAALYFITAYRGPYAHMDGGEKTGRSIFLSICILLSLLIAQYASLLLSMYYNLLPALKAHLGTF